MTRSPEYVVVGNFPCHRKWWQSPGIRVASPEMLKLWNRASDVRLDKPVIPFFGMDNGAFRQVAYTLLSQVDRRKGAAKMSLFYTTREKLLRSNHFFWALPGPIRCWFLAFFQTKVRRNEACLLPSISGQSLHPSLPHMLSKCGI